MTEAEWLACEDPEKLGEFVRGRVDPHRFRWLAVEWSRRAIDFLNEWDAKWIEAYAAWVENNGPHPLDVCEIRPFDYMDRPTKVLAWARRCSDDLRREDPMTASISAAMSAVHDCPFIEWDGSKFVDTRGANERESQNESTKGYTNQGDLFWSRQQYFDREMSLRFCNQFRDVTGNPFRPVAVDPAWRTATAVGIAQAIYDDRAFDRLPILADALQDAGCENADILGHCRGDGPHVRGCWVVDLVLGKE